MNKTSEKFLDQLLQTPSPSGSETRAAKIWREYTKKYADKVYGDVHGNSFAVLNPDAKFKFMLTGHIDEIGLMVRYIDDNGFLYVKQIGGSEPAQLVGQRIIVNGSKGPVLGVVGRKAIHLIKPEDRKKGIRTENIWVDIGAKNKKDALKRVSVGDSMVVDVRCRKLNADLMVSRASDDKVGAFVTAEVIRSLSRKKINISVIAVATVQEEIGVRGAQTSSYSVMPDAGIAIDVNHATDHPESNPKTDGDVKLSQGPTVARGPNINPILEKYILNTAKSQKIPVQITGEPGVTGTDARAIQLARGGVATALLGIPNRYMHSPVEVFSVKDIDNLVKLITGLLEKHPAKKDYRP
jgi:endoglucanase